MNTAKKEIVALAAAYIVAICGAGAGATGLVTSSQTAERVRALEVQYDGVEKRLDRIEKKLDRALEERR